MITKKTALILCGLLLLASTSCQKEETRATEPTEAVAEYQGEEFSLDINVSLDEDALLPSEQSLRSISLGHEEVTQQGKQVMKPTIRLVEGDNTKMRIFLRKLGDPASLTMFDAPVKISRDAATGTYRFELLQGEVRLKKSLSKITEGEWYISGFYGGSNFAQSTSQEQYNIQIQGAKSSATTRESVFEYNFPLAFGWSKLERAERSGNKSYGMHRNLRLKPVGTLLGIELENDLLESVTLSSVKMSGTDASFSGSFVPSRDNDDALRAGSVPTFSPTALSSTSEPVIEKNINPEPVLLPAAQRHDGRLYVWFMPLHQGDETIRFTLEAAQRKSNSSPESAQDRFVVKGKEATFRDSFRYAVSVSGGFQSGRVYIFPLRVSSDLMITEVYHKYDNGLSYAAVELYNPNKTPIDLSDYALARVKNQFLDVGYCTVGEIGGKCRGKTAIRQEYYTLYPPSFDKSRRSEANALILPLSLSTTHNWSPYRLGVNRDNKTQDGAADYSASNPIKLRFLTESGYGTLDNNDLPAGAKPMLHGGKTLVVLGDGYQPANATLKSGGLSAQLYEAYKKGYCQYIVALDNRSTAAKDSEIKNDNQGGFSGNRNSGVMNLRYEDGLLLVKRIRQKGGETRRVIDTTTPNLYSGGQDENYKTGNALDYWLNMMDLKQGNRKEKSTAVYSANYQTRTVIERLPSYGWSRHHWNVHRQTDNLDRVVSLGSRRWLGSGDQASWAAVPQYSLPQ